MTGPNMSGHWQPLSRAQKRDSRDRYSRDKARHCKTMHPIVRGGPDGSAPPWPGGAHNGRMNATADTLPKASILVRARANPSANSAVAMGFKRSVGGAHSREPVDDAAEQKILQASNPAENGGVRHLGQAWRALRPLVHIEQHAVVVGFDQMQVVAEGVEQLVRADIAGLGAEGCEQLRREQHRVASPAVADRRG